jgi:hypothetical protein
MLFVTHGGFPIEGKPLVFDCLFSCSFAAMQRGRKTARAGKGRGREHVLKRIWDPPLSDSF